MHILQTAHFTKSVKRLKKNQKTDLDKAVQIIIETPDIGTKKVADLSNMRVYKFHMVKQPMLLAYIHEADTITLLALGSHENFYRDLKKTI